jgi:hypothetical protein
MKLCQLQENEWNWKLNEVSQAKRDKYQMFYDRNAEYRSKKL